MDRRFASQMRVARPFDCQSGEFTLHVTNVTALLIYISFTIIIYCFFPCNFTQLSELRGIFPEIAIADSQKQMIVCFPSPDLIGNGTRIAWEARTCVFPNGRRQPVDVRRNSRASF
jgi:hypothetical protein